LALAEGNRNEAGEGNTSGVIEPVGSTDERAPGMGRGIVSMVIGTSTIVFAAAAAVGVVFAFAPPADARFMHQCSGKYEAAAKAGCGVNAAKARPPRPRGITLGVGDVVSITIFEPSGGLFVPSDAGARPGNFVTLPNQIVDSNGKHSSAVREHDPSRWQDTFRSSTSDQRNSKGLASVSEREIDAPHPAPDRPRITGACRSPRLDRL